jgi:hypothetical protein
MWDHSRNLFCTRRPGLNPYTAVGVCIFVRVKKDFISKKRKKEKSEIGSVKEEKKDISNPLMMS